MDHDISMYTKKTFTISKQSDNLFIKEGSDSSLAYFWYKRANIYIYIYYFFFSKFKSSLKNKIFTTKP